ncbi:MAG: DNA mismatch repair endonuclease MutL [candidate division SR1 bacterium]|nr:DNA mismatch repair endonuclease MutL [candidate division SR1 bacterium]
MSIHKLPDYVINRLKAGEVVQRPASLLKELVENSLDAEATKLEITINDGGKSLLALEDNGTGIELSDMDLLLERYATSKIESEKDLYSLESYGFRGEALASISEVSKITVLTKTQYAEIGTKLVRRGNENLISHLPVPFEHGTLIRVEDLFYNVPARLKFLKSAQTEFYYCYNYFIDVALYHYDKAFVLKKNDKLVFDLKPSRELSTRILDIFKKDRSEKLIPLAYKEDSLKITGVVSDPTLRFGSAENIKIYVNSRPVQDKIIKKAIMDAYSRQITPGEYPLVILMLEIDPQEVDVNVHPAKLQVKFMNSQQIYRAVYQSILQLLGNHKIGSVGNEFFGKQGELQQKSDFSSFGQVQRGNQFSQTDFSGLIEGVHLEEEQVQNREKPFSTSLFSPQENISFSHFGSLDEHRKEQEFFFHQEIGEYQILGQLRNMYIALQADDALYLIDQHALAERIAFEKMKIEKDLSSEPLLQPLKFEITQIANLEEKIEELNQLGFDIGMLGENVIAIYALPKVFVVYPIDMGALLNYVLYLDEISFDHILDGIYATKACKASIKAGHKLSYLQMEQLVADGFSMIPGMFVCQHGRPFFVKMDKKHIDGLFDR